MRSDYNRYGLAPEITWKPAKMPGNMAIVLHELRAWRQQGRPFMNARELGEACGLDEHTTKSALAWLERRELIDGRREPT